MKLSNKKLILVFALALAYNFLFAQCDDLKGNKTTTNNWETVYRNYFGVDTTFPLIKADSVLIYYFSNTENESNYGMPCCYMLAEKYAQTELTENLQLFYQKLEKPDSINFSKAQQAWQAYYDSEWDFLKNAFISYGNFSKYGLGREVMIETQAGKYENDQGPDIDHSKLY